MRHETHAMQYAPRSTMRRYTHRVWIGRWIDKLDDAARDRIIEEQNMIAEAWVEASGERCLAATAQDLTWKDWGERNARWLSVDPRSVHIGFRFPLLAHRVGLARAVQLVKARAARGNRVNLPTARESYA